MKGILFFAVLFVLSLSCIMAISSITVPQLYQSTGLGGFISIKKLSTITPTFLTKAGVKISFNYDLIMNPDPRGCYKIGDMIDPCSVYPSINTTMGKTCPRHCVERDIVDPSVALAIQDYASSYLPYYFEKLLVINPVQDIIDYSNSSTLANLNLMNTATDYLSGDLVVIMSLIPAADAISSYSICIQRDQYGRCTVGILNLVPNQLPTPASLNVIFDPEALQHISTFAIREMIHLLGGHFNSAVGKVDENGGKLSKATYLKEEYDSNLRKNVQKVISLNVLQVARTQFNCSTLDGVPLEDDPLFAGMLWESRIMGAEVMSEGRYSGESYLSDLTLAYLVDTGFFLINNYVTDPAVTIFGSNLAGRFFPATGTSVQEASLKPNSAKQTAATLIAPGHVRLGNVGCNLFGSPTNIGNFTTIQCSDASENLVFGTCTPDNRYTAYCSLSAVYNNQDPNYLSPLDYSCISSDGVTAPVCESNTNAPLLPSNNRYYSNNVNLGGYSLSMDYLNPPIGLQSCLDIGSTQNFYPFSSNSELTNEAQANAVSYAMTKNAGGQSFCPNCRCFQSSLYSFNSGYLKSYPVYGMCYRSNCYSNSYLQIGIQSSWIEQISWFACTLEGKIPLPGFAGYFHCPDPKIFCQSEDVTGIFYFEMNLVYQWAMVGLIILCPLIIILIAIFFPGCFYHVQVFCNQLLGIDVETGFAANVFQSEEVYKKSKPRRKLSKIIMVALNVISITIGIFLILVGIFAYFGQNLYATARRQCLPLLVFGFLLLIMSYCAIRGARSSIISLKIMFYFYCCGIAAVLACFLALLALAYPNVWQVFLNFYWNSYSVYFPDSFQTLTQQQAIIKVNALFAQNNGIVILVFTFIGLYIIAGLVCSGFIIGAYALTRSVAKVNSLLLIGLSVALYFEVPVYQLRSDIVSQILITISLLLLFVNAFVGWRASNTRTKLDLQVYIFLSITSFLMCIIASAVSYQRIITATETYVNSLTAAEILTVSGELGVSSSLITQTLEIRTQIAGCGLYILALIQFIAFFSAASIARRADKVERLLNPSYLHTRAETSKLRAMRESINPLPSEN